MARETRARISHAVEAVGPSPVLQKQLQRTNALTDAPFCRKHGKFRPQLPALIATNPPDLVNSITKEAFAVYSSSNPPESATAITQLCKLKGVGPATASLILSVYDPVQAPFFSDELFRWICWDERAGWDRKIKYDAKEYRMLCEGVQALMERFGSGAEGTGGKGVQAVELEKVAYVLGKSAGDKKLAATIEEEAGEGDGVVEKGEGSREISPPASKRAKPGEDADSKPLGGQGTEMGEGETTGGEADEMRGKAATSTPPRLPTRAGGAEASDRSTRRTSQRTTRGRPGGENNDEKAAAAPVRKRKRKGKSDIS